MKGLVRSKLAERGVALLLLLLAVWAVPSLAQAEPLDFGSCFETGEASLTFAALPQTPIPQGGPTAQGTGAGDNRLAQSQLCCCTGFDGQKCCARARTCDVSPPGCFCRPKQD